MANAGNQKTIVASIDTETPWQSLGAALLSSSCCVRHDLCTAIESVGVYMKCLECFCSAIVAASSVCIYRFEDNALQKVNSAA